MRTFYDNAMITAEEFEAILNKNFSSCCSVPMQKGAGSFCRFVEYNGKGYALLSKRGQSLVFNVIKSIAGIINGRGIPVPILGGGFDDKPGDNYTIIMPKVEGISLPSYVYTKGKNIALVSASQSLSQDAISTLAQECVLLNEKNINIDFHGGNFLIEDGSDVIRMLDLKTRGQKSGGELAKRFMRLFAYDKLQVFSNPAMVDEIRNTHGINVSFITAQNIIKAYIALCKTGMPEDKVVGALRQLYGEKTNIEDFENVVE